MAKRGLGRGIDALMSAQEINEPTDTEQPVQPGVEKVALSKLQPNPHQPRTRFADEGLEELAGSISERGVIQPILVEDNGTGGYTIIAGERRFRAAQKAGLEEIPVITRTFSDAEKREIALVENIQRENLSPIDEAQAYRDIMNSAGIGQDELARRVGKNRSTVANALRLLKLPGDAREAVADGRVSPGHARALLSITDQENVNTLLGEILDEGLSVRVAEQRARELEHGIVPAAAESRDASANEATSESDGGEPRASGGRSSAASTTPKKTPEMRDLEDRLIERLGTKVSITGSNDRGRVEISYYSTEELEGIYRALAGEDPSAL